jgi:hypothetical protein
LFAFADPTADLSVRRVAGPADCTNEDVSDSYSLVCVPDIPTTIGAPSEAELTDTNPGVASPARSGRD